MDDNEAQFGAAIDAPREQVGETHAADGIEREATLGAAEQASPRLSSVIDEWLAKWRPESPDPHHPVQYLSGAWHHFTAAAEDLKERLAKGVVPVLVAVALLAGLVGPVMAQSAGLALPATQQSVLQLGAGQLPVGQGVGSNPSAVTVGGDATLNASGSLIVTKTNGANLGTAAIANTGTSGGTVPLLNTANTFAAGVLQTFAGHVASGGSSPSLSSCGTSPAIIGDDKDGQVTMGTGSPTGCVITFASAYTAAPICTVSWLATPLASQSYAVSNTAITLTQTGTSSNKVAYHCSAQAGG